MQTSTNVPFGRHHDDYPTRNTLDGNVRASMVALLNAVLADGIDLALATKQAHWNLKGPSFIAVHEMLDGFRTGIDVWTDDLAERAVQLGGVALGTTQAVSRAVRLEPYPTTLHAVPEHLTALIERFAIFGTIARDAIGEASDAGDADTADLFTGISRAGDKQLWFLEAHLAPPV